MILTILVNDWGKVMIVRFKKLDNTERKRILDSAYRAFTDTPYALASTNTIVLNAGISKGKLFYYFQSKETLFDYLITHGLHYIKTAYVDKINTLERDCLKRLMLIAEPKKRAYNDEPYLFAFMSYVYMHEQHRIKAKSLKLIQEYQSIIEEKMKENIDISLFRADIDANLVMRLLKYSINGYQDDLETQFKSKDIAHVYMQPYYKDYETIIETLRKIYYKTEAL